MTSKFFESVRANIEKLKREFPGKEGFWMVSLDHPARVTRAGAMCALTLEGAAKALTENSYRMATSEEIEAYQKAQDEASTQIVKAEAKRAGSVPEVIASLLRTGFAAERAAGTKKATAQS